MLIIVIEIFSRCILAFEKLFLSNPLEPLWKLVKFLAKQISTEYTKSVYGPYLKTNWGDYTFELCVTGRGGYQLADTLKRNKNPELVFVDIGANLGVFSLVADKNPYFSKIYAIEPNTNFMDVLQQNVKHNQAHKIVLLPFGISDSTGQMQLNQHKTKNGSGNLSEKRETYHDVQMKDHSLLDAIIDENPNKRFVLNIDVKGSEPQVMRQLLLSRMKRHVDAIFIKVNPKLNSAEQIEDLYKDLRLMGLKEVRRFNGTHQYDSYWSRPEEYRIVETERHKLGTWEQDKTKAPRYSICISNYNMADTIETALSSVVEQLDERFEVVVIDDGSSDDSIVILQQLAERYERLRFISLRRDPKRKLGETRNISIRAARGEYVLLHIDADDVWEPYLCELTAVFHKVEEAVGKDVMVMGPQMVIGKRDFLLKYGPYKNLYHVEDRNMLQYFAYMNLVIFLDFKVFRSRLKRPQSIQFFKSIKDIWTHLLYDMRLNSPKSQYITDVLKDPFVKRHFNRRIALLKVILLFPAWIKSRFMPTIQNYINWDEFIDYRSANRGTFIDLMQRYGHDDDMSFLSPKAREIFSYSIKYKGLGIPE